MDGILLLHRIQRCGHMLALRGNRHLVSGTSSWSPSEGVPERRLGRGAAHVAAVRSSIVLMCAGPSMPSILMTVHIFAGLPADNQRAGRAESRACLHYDRAFQQLPLSMLP